jgi:hypothetical protein
MSEHITAAIADCEAKIQQLTDVVKTLRWFVQEFPQTAAAVTPTPPRTAGRKKPVFRLPENADFEKQAERLLAALRVKSPQRTGEAMKAARLTFPNTGYQGRFLQKLADAGRIVRSGNARGASVGLPGKPAKEEP